MLCLSGFELYPRWVPLKTNEEIAPQSREILQTSFETCKDFPYYSKVKSGWLLAVQCKLVFVILVVLYMVQVFRNLTDQE